MLSLQTVQSSEAVQGELNERMERLKTELVVFKSLMPHDVSFLLYLLSTNATQNMQISIDNSTLFETGKQKLHLTVAVNDNKDYKIDFQGNKDEPVDKFL